MKLNTFKYKDHFKDLTIKFTSFHNLSLLVGASGVGKTQILRSILNLQKIASGRSLNGIEWELAFDTKDGDQYTWTGRFGISDKLGDYPEYAFKFMDLDDIEEEELPNIIEETLSKNRETIVKRDKEEIIFKGDKTVKLSKKQSSIHLLKEEEEINKVSEAFKKIKFTDHTSSRRSLNLLFLDYSEPKSKLNTFKKIKESNKSVIAKLYYAYKNKLDVFSEIEERFIEIFPQVEKISFEKYKNHRIPMLSGETPVLSLKEKEIDKLIDITRISSGMLRTLTQIAEIYLSSEGTVFLIDEFENSLGVNCIDELTEYILSPENDAQFIVTSHHPYIINNIEPLHWKVVARKAGIILTFNASDLDIGKSKHDAFIQLTNTAEYRTGMFEN